MFPTTTSLINPMHVAAIVPLLRGDIERSATYTHEAVLSGGARVRLTTAEASGLSSEVDAVLAAVRSSSMAHIVA